MNDIASLHSRAAQGDAEARFQLGVRYDNADGVPRDPVAAANWYRFAAEQGHGLAQLHLGLMLNAGDVGFERDDVDAARWFERAAQQGVADAQFNLALLYYNAEGVDQSDAIAYQWFAAAAAQGHARAQFNLGALFANGHGVEQNFPAAYRFWLMASMQGDANANENLAMIRDKLSTAEAEASQAEAVEWFNQQR